MPKRKRGNEGEAQQAMQKDNPTKHMRTHTGEKKLLQCSFCSYRCSYKSHLTRHLRTHTGEKPFQCPLCSYRCSRKSHLTRHLRTHIVEKPFQYEPIRMTI